MKRVHGITARWVSERHVEVCDGLLTIANVYFCNSIRGDGWKVFPLSSARRISRKAHTYPSDAIQSMYGKRIQIQGSRPTGVAHG